MAKKPDPLDEQIARALLQGKAFAADPIGTLPPQSPPRRHGPPDLKLVDMDPSDNKTEQQIVADHFRDIADRIEHGDLPAIAFAVALLWHDAKEDINIIPFTYHNLTALEAVGVLEACKAKVAGK